MPHVLIVALALFGFFEGAAAQNNTTTTAFPTIPPIPPEPETTPRASCPNPGLSDSIREIFLDMHNRLRASVARGQTERNGNLGIAPPTHTMYKLVCDMKNDF
ncbi:hypothetical protein Y032_0335g2863 [Ancylostoma ceylanicum]|uniref:SCP domain-containing protein n=1 Tax=Ancylostoma ceylanicum TaxID=53326 RepID=A0A016RYJ5_9BILA|nr:hypothetical protein Y032_0335g2863 [Ancylostoma ceylanicum]